MSEKLDYATLGAETRPQNPFAMRHHNLGRMRDAEHKSDEAVEIVKMLPREFVSLVQRHPIFAAATFTAGVFVTATVVHHMGRNETANI